MTVFEATVGVPPPEQRENLEAATGASTRSEHASRAMQMAYNTGMFDVTAMACCHVVGYFIGLRYTMTDQESKIPTLIDRCHGAMVQGQSLARAAVIKTLQEDPPAPVEEDEK